jgi:hypothetical protein
MLDGKTAADVIKRKLQDADSIVDISLQKGRMLTARLVDPGIEVSDLGNQPFLPWKVFEEAVDLMVRKGGRAERGDAMSSRLGEEGLPLDSIEGHIAHVVYGKQEGDSVFRRISPIAAILVWAGICDSAPGELIIR